jgi:outer membrane protein OmpA-like peptidoglycan-associated protein
MESKIMKKLLLASVISLGLSACATTDDPNRQAKTGAAIGAAAGAIIGYAIDDGAGGVLAGAAVGAAAGAGVGSYMDKQQQEMEAALEQEQAAHDIEVQRLRDETLKIDIASEVSFDFGSAALKGAFMPTLQKVTDVLVRYPHTVIHVVGHTDNVGSEAFNMELSRKRAQNVVNYFVDNGIASRRLVAVGRGESAPRATNDTEAGRQLNRRVEIYVKPIVEGQEQDAYETPREQQMMYR